MITFFKIVVKAIVVVAGLCSIVFSAFMPAIYAIVHLGSGEIAAAWLLFYLIAFIAVMIALSQENTFSKKVEKVSKACWSW